MKYFVYLIITKRINKSNVHHSLRVSELIDREYVPIDWQVDFKSGYRWSESCWSQDVSVGHLPGVDIKVPWELARLQHLPQIAIAYALSKKHTKILLFFHFEYLNYIIWSTICSTTMINPIFIVISWTT